MKKVFLLIVLSIFLQGCATGYKAQELQGGKKAFEQGDFKDAFHRLLPLAVDGNAEAEYAVGYMYYYGYGVPADTVSGIFWMQKAAAKHNRHAVNALANIKNS